MAQATDLERLVVQLSADVRTYQKSLDKARGITNKTARDIENRFNRMNQTISRANTGLKAFAGGFLGAFTAESVVRGIGGIIKKYGELADVSKRVGVGAEGLQTLGFAAQQSGVEFDTLTKALAKLNLEVGKAQKNQKGDLFDIFEANNKKFSTDVVENFRTVAELIRNARTEQEKAVIGAAAFGKSYAELLPLLNEGAAGIARLEQQFRDTGAVISQDLVEAADEFGDRWDAAFAKFQGEGAKAVLIVAREIENIIKQGGVFADLLKDIAGNLSGNISENLRLGRNPLTFLSVNGNVLSGGGPLDQAESAVEDLQKKLDALVAGGALADNPEVQRVQEQLQQAIELVKQLRRELGFLPGLGTGTSHIPATTLNTSESRFRTDRAPAGSVTTIVPGGGEGAETFDKAVDKFVKVVIDFENAGGKRIGKNPLSSAEGVGQFINRTFIEQFRKAFPGLAHLSDPEILARRTGPGSKEVAVTLIKQYARENAQFLADKLKVPLDSITTAQLQLAHFLGPEGARKVLQAPAGTPVSQVLPPDVIAANRGVLQGKTTDEIVAEANARAGLVGVMEKQRDALQDLADSTQVEIDSMKVRQAELTATTEAERILAREMEIRNQLTQKGVPITDEINARIHATAVALETEETKIRSIEAAQDAARDSADRMAEAQEQAAQTMQQIGQAFGGALQGFIGDLVQGKKLTDALRDALINLGQSLLDIALNNLFSGAGGGGLLGGLFGGGGAGAGGLLGGLFHTGGTVGAGRSGRRLSPLAFAGAQRFHDGGLVTGEVPAILRRGEIVSPNLEALMDTARRASGGGAAAGIVQNNTFIAPDFKASLRSQNQLARTAGSELARVNRTL